MLLSKCEVCVSKKSKFIANLKQNKLMSRKHKQVCTSLNFTEHFLVRASAVTRCVSISAFASLLGISIGVTSCSEALKIYAITSGITNYKSMIKEKKKKHDKTVLLAKT